MKVLHVIEELQYKYELIKDNKTSHIKAYKYADEILLNTKTNKKNSRSALLKCVQ